MIQIANPIYDAVFKFMMNDNEVAKLLLSAIIGEPIKELVFQPTELHIPIQDSITVLRMDFKAVIELPNGNTKTAILEIQKAKLHTDIMRFRKYLGEQYQDKNNSKIVKLVKARKQEGVWIEHRKAFPILSIYFLGHRLDHIKNIPVIKVARSYYDLATGDQLQEREDFIESLTHDSYVIQIPYIKGNQRTDLEQLLQIFAQEDIEDHDLKHILTNAPTQKLIQAEDEVINEFKQYTRALEQSEKIIVEQDKAIEEKDKAIEEKDKTIEEKDKTIKEKDKAIKKKNKAIKEKEVEMQTTKASLSRAVQKFIALGLPDKEIAAVLNLTIEEVTQIRDNKS